MVTTHQLIDCFRLFFSYNNDSISHTFLNDNFFISEQFIITLSNIKMTIYEFSYLHISSWVDTSSLVVYLIEGASPNIKILIFQYPSLSCFIGVRSITSPYLSFSNITLSSSEVVLDS